MSEEQFIDMMAAQAMQALISAYHIPEEDIATYAYDQAEAMWKEKHRREEAALEGEA